MTQVMGIPQLELLSIARNSQVSVGSILLSYGRNIPKDLKISPPLKYPFKCFVLWIENQVIFLTGKTNQSSFSSANRFKNFAFCHSFSIAYDKDYTEKWNFRGHGLDGSVISNEPEKGESSWLFCVAHRGDQNRNTQWISRRMSLQNERAQM